MFGEPVSDPPRNPLFDKSGQRGPRQKNMTPLGQDKFPFYWALPPRREILEIESPHKLCPDLKKTAVGTGLGLRKGGIFDRCHKLRNTANHEVAPWIHLRFLIYHSFYTQVKGFRSFGETEGLLFSLRIFPSEILARWKAVKSPTSWTLSRAPPGGLKIFLPLSPISI